MRAVGEQLPWRSRIAGHRRIDFLPYALARPAVEAIVDGRAGTVIRRAVAPASAAAQHMNDAAQDTPVIDPRRTAVMRQKRLDPRPLLIIQPEQSAHSESSSMNQLNHKSFVEFR